MFSRRQLLATTATTLATTLVPAQAATAAARRPAAGPAARIARPTVEYAPHPLGLDT
ncbi:hypothetical protein G5C51_36845, partial [Streptomyces sp. A7024]|nr:hypothetical protein [Streptomyces coryli]